MSTNPARESLNVRPTFIRRTTDSSEIEMAQRPAEQQVRPSLSRSTSNLLPQDVYDPAPVPGTNPLRPTIRERLSDRLRAPAAPLPEPVRSAIAHAFDGVVAHWRDLTVGGAIAALASWAIWATVKIHKQDNMPYCVFDEGKEPWA